MENKEERPGYYSVIPADVRYDRSLPPNAKLLYSELTALSNREGYCYASNNYFASLYGVTPQAVSKWIGLLAKGGYIRTEYVRDGGEIRERRIYITPETNVDTYQQKIKGVSTKVEGGINKRLRGYQQKVKGNNTYNNKFNITDEYISAGAETPDDNANEENPADNPCEKQCGKASATPCEKPCGKHGDKPPLTEREPENDYERIEKAYLVNYEALRREGLVTTERPIVDWRQVRGMERRLIKEYGADNLVLAVERSREHEFCVQKGYVLTTILARPVLADLINGNGWKKSYREHKDEQMRALWEREHRPIEIAF